MPVEIAKVGLWPTMTGKLFPLSAEILAEAAAHYDPAKHRAPFIITHDENNQPTFSESQPWKAGALVKGLFVRGNSLFAEPEKVDPAYKKFFDEGRIPALSTMFYRPQDPGNPTPGKWNIRHVAGVLVPGIKGLAQPAFSDPHDGLVISFMEGMPAPIITSTPLIRVLRSIKSMLATLADQEQADKAIPEYELESLLADAVIDQADDYAAAPPIALSEGTPMPEPDPMIAQLQAELAEARQRTADMVATAARDKEQSSKREALAFSEGLFDQGKITAAEKPGVAAEYLAALNSGPISFEEGKPAVDPLASLKARYSTAKPKISYRTELAPDSNPVDGSLPPVQFAAPPGTVVDPDEQRLYGLAKEYAAKHGCDLIVAYKAVGGK